MISFLSYFDNPVVRYDAVRPTSVRIEGKRGILASGDGPANYVTRGQPNLDVGTHSETVDFSPHHRGVRPGQIVCQTRSDHDRGYRDEKQGGGSRPVQSLKTRSTPSRAESDGFGRTAAILRIRALIAGLVVSVWPTPRSAPIREASLIVRWPATIVVTTMTWSGSVA